MPLSTRSPRRVASDTLPIQDRERLAKFVSRLVAPFGSQRLASRALGIPQTQISRMLNRELGELARQNVRRLIALVGPTERRTLARVFTMPSPGRLRRVYLAWIQEQLAIASRGTPRRWYRTLHGISDEVRHPAVVGNSDRDAERKALWRYVQELDPAFVRDVDAALGKVRDRGYRELALVRILDPLINGPDSGFIEPSWREWRKDEKGRNRLKRFIRLGVNRERLLLEMRLRTSERAMNVLGASHEEFEKLYGESAAPLIPQQNPFDLLKQFGYLHGANSVAQSDKQRHQR